MPRTPMPSRQRPAHPTAHAWTAGLAVAALAMLTAACDGDGDGTAAPTTLASTTTQPGVATLCDLSNAAEMSALFGYELADGEMDPTVGRPTCRWRDTAPEDTSFAFTVSITEHAGGADLAELEEIAADALTLTKDLHGHQAHHDCYQDDGTTCTDYASSIAVTTDDGFVEVSATNFVVPDDFTEEQLNGMLWAAAEAVAARL